MPRLEKTNVFDPTEFRRTNVPHHVNLEQAWLDLVTVLDAFSRDLDPSVDVGQFLGVPAGKAQDHFVWKRNDDTVAHEVTLPGGTARALNDLYYAICRRLETEYEKGVEEGIRVLRRMAQGELTIEEVSRLQ